MNVADVVGTPPVYGKHFRNYRFLHHSLVYRPGRQYLIEAIYSTYVTFHRCFPAHLGQKSLT